MTLPHIELLDTFSVWRDYFNFMVNEFNTATPLPEANTIVRRDETGRIVVFGFSANIDGGTINSIYNSSLTIDGGSPDNG